MTPRPFAPPGPPPGIRAAGRVRLRDGLRGGVPVRLTGIGAGSRVTATLKRGSRVVGATTATLRTTAARTLRLRLRPAALGRVPARGVTLTLAVAVRTPGAAPHTVVRRLRLVP